MPEREITDEEIALTARAVAAEQNMAEWTYDAECMAAFYRILIVGEVPEPVANVMLLNAQINYYENCDSMIRPLDDDDDDGDD